MNCEYCGSELKEGANFCTICGMPVNSPQEQPAAQPAEQPVHQASASYPDNGGALRGYMSYTSGEYNTRTQSDPAYRTADTYSSPRQTASSSQDTGNEWASWVGIVCAVLAIKGIFVTVPGILLGVAAIVFGSIGCRSNMKVPAICSIVIGSLAVLGSLGMAAVWHWIFDLAGEYMFQPEFFW